MPDLLNPISRPALLQPCRTAMLRVLPGSFFGCHGRVGRLANRLWPLR